MNKHLHLNFHKQIRFNLKGADGFSFNRYTQSGKILQKIFHSKGPLIIATDGAHEKENPVNGKNPKTSAAFCICILDKYSYYHRAEASPFPKSSSQKGRLWTPRRFEYYASFW